MINCVNQLDSTGMSLWLIRTARGREVMRTPIRAMTDDPVLLRIIDRLRLNGHTEKDLLRSVGLKDTTFNRWKFENSKSFMQHIDKIADYLGVSIDYLVRGQEPDEGTGGFVAEEKGIIDLYRKLSRKRQEMILNLLHDFAEVEERQESEHGTEA